MIDRGKSDFDRSKFFEILKRDFLTNNKPKLRLLWSFLDHFIIFYGQIDTHSGLFRLLKTFSFSTDQIDGSKLHDFRGKNWISKYFGHFERKIRYRLKWPNSCRKFQQSDIVFGYWWYLWKCVFSIKNLRNSNFHQMVIFERMGGFTFETEVFF